MNRKFFINLLFRQKKSLFPDTAEWDGRWYPDAGTLGTLIIASPGRGKTWLVAQYILNIIKTSPNASLFILDWSGDLSNKLLYLIALEPYVEREKILHRVIYDELGHQRYVLPTPEFSSLYGVSMAEQIDRVEKNWERLSVFLGGAPILGNMAIFGLAPRIMETIAAVKWQITEFPDLLDNPSRLAMLFRDHRETIPQQVREWLTSRFINLKAHEHELRSYALSKLTRAISSPAALVKLGGSTPAYTPSEIIKNAGILLFNGSNMLNQESAQHYLFAQMYSLMMQVLNQRVPSDPTNSPVYMIFDEAYSIISNPGIAESVGKIQSLYRSRNVRPIVIIQALSQLAEPLDRQIWNMGTKIFGKIEDADEAETTAHQIFRYVDQQQKSPAASDNGQPVFESPQGQVLKIADYIQHMKSREFFIKRYLTEANEDPLIRHIERTPEVTQTTPEESVASIKERLLKLHGRPCEEVMESIRSRQVSATSTTNPKQLHRST